MATKKAKPAAALAVELWDIDKIIPYANNAKIHTPDQIDKLAAIIKRDSFRVPIDIDENGVIIRGHGRRLAALQLGLKKIPVFVERGMTEEQKDAARISDNMVGRGDYNEQLLGEEVMRLAELDDFDISSLAMDDLELGEIFEKYATELPIIIEEELPAELREPSSETSKPRNEGVEYEPSYAVIVECSGEQEQRELYTKLVADGRKCKVQTM